MKEKDEWWWKGRGEVRGSVMCRRSRKKKKKIEAKPRTCIFPKVFLPLPVSLFLPFLTSFCCRPICPRLPRGYRRQLIAVWFSLFSMSSFKKKNLFVSVCARVSPCFDPSRRPSQHVSSKVRKKSVFGCSLSLTHANTRTNTHTQTTAA